MFHFAAATLDDWRPQARDMIAHGVPPSDVSWGDPQQISLFGSAQALLPLRMPSFNIPRDFMGIARAVACHTDERRFDLLYQLMWRLLNGEKHLLQVSTDPLMHTLRMMEKAVRRDAHKMKAFVRFRRVDDEGGEHFIAWHRPDHHIVRIVAPFFMRRFTAMKWTILTPDETVHWDEDELHYGPGVPESEAPQDDAMEDLWRDYYRSIFNPARIKINAMKREMPTRHWHTLPETRIIPAMLAEAPTRVEKMIAYTEGSLISAADYLPAIETIDTLRVAAKACQGCELHSMASQTVFGTGPADAALMLIGEQPGDAEDREGVAFIGPAGQLLDEALAASGLTRNTIYITNAVKHFRFQQQGGQRLHKSPARSHIHACKPWLNAEIAAIKPRAILCLGNTAARALISPNFIMKENRGRWVESAPHLMATYHPAAILRAFASQQDELRRHLIDDLRTAAAFVA